MITRIITDVTSCKLISALSLILNYYFAKFRDIDPLFGQLSVGQEPSLFFVYMFDVEHTLNTDIIFCSASRERELKINFMDIISIRLQTLFIGSSARAERLDQSSIINYGFP